MSLLDALHAAEELRARSLERPLATWRPLPGQEAVLLDESRFRLFRGPNQAIGKTTAGAVDLTCSATGVHPWAPQVVTPFPIEAWVICASWSQSVAIQKKLWELLPKDLLHPSVSFTETWGFAPSKSPIVRIKHVPSGGWSTIRVKTAGQGGLNLAGATIQYAWFDEPPMSQRVFTEVQKRVMKAGRFGRVLMTMTPVNASIDWIKEMAEAGDLVDHHHRLEPHELVPVGAVRPITLADGTACDQAWIEQVIRETPPHEVPVVCHGEWHFVTDAPRFPAFKTAGPESHVVGRGAVPTDRHLDLYLGFDHGHRDHAEVALLVAVEALEPFPRVWVLDEYASLEGSTSAENDAEGVAAMLTRWGVHWSPDYITAAHGDIAHRWGNTSGRKGALRRKGNEEFTAAWVRMFGSAPEPPLGVVKRGPANLPGATDYGVKWLHQIMLRPDGFHIVEGCERLILSMQRYKGKPNSDWSHAVDALRYALSSQIYVGSRGRDAGPVVRLFP